MFPFVTYTLILLPSLHKHAGNLSNRTQVTFLTGIIIYCQINSGALYSSASFDFLKLQKNRSVRPLCCHSWSKKDACSYWWACACSTSTRHFFTCRSCDLERKVEAYKHNNSEHRQGRDNAPPELGRNKRRILLVVGQDRNAAVLLQDFMDLGGRVKVHQIRRWNAQEGVHYPQTRQWIVCESYRRPEEGRENWWRSRPH